MAAQMAASYFDHNFLTKHNGNTNEVSKHIVLRMRNQLDVHFPNSQNLKKNVTNLLSVLIPDPDKKRSSSEKLCSLELPELDSISNYPN